MANSILKLSVEDKEYNSKLKSAAEGIQHLAKRAHDLQGDFADLDKAELEFIRDLGYMNTSARTASGNVRELETAYKGLATTYNQLSDFEKNDEGGKALAASLEMLKQRAQDAREAMNEATKSLNDNGTSSRESSSILDQLASKFTINIDALKLFNFGLDGVKAALDVAKDAFFNNEEQLDEWGRVVESSHSLYQGFLNALNTGGISGFLSNINNIVQAARDAYDALDALGTYNAFNQINVEKTRTGMTESIADYRGGQGTKEAVKAAGEAYKKELQDRKRLENEAYLAAVKRMASERGINAKDLQDALSGTYGHYQDLKNVQPTGVGNRYTPGIMPGSQGYYTQYTYAQNREEKLGEALRHLNDTELQSLQALGAQAQRTGNEIAQVDKQLTRVLNGKQPGGEHTNRTISKAGKPDGILPEGSVAVLNKELQELQKQQSLATDTKGWKQYQAQIDEVKTKIAAVKGELVNLDLKQIQGVGLAPAGPRDALTAGQTSAKTLREQVQMEITTQNVKIDETTLHTLMKTAVQNGIDTLDPQFGILGDKIAQGFNVPDKAWEGLQEQINEKLKEMGIDPIEIDFETGEGKGGNKKKKKGDSDYSDEKKEIAQTQQIISGVQGIFTGLQQMGIEMPKGIETIMSGLNIITGILTTINTVLTVIELLTAVSAARPFAHGGVVHAAGGFAGIVPGTQYSGDNIPAMLDAGEVVLNRAQTAALADYIQNSDRGGGYQPSYITGEQIHIAHNRYLKRTGKGELVTWK